MKQVYAGLDISDEQTHIRPMHEDGRVAWRGKCASDPQAVPVMLRGRARLGVVPVRAVLETGPHSVFPHHGRPSVGASRHTCP